MKVDEFKSELGAVIGSNKKTMDYIVSRLDACAKNQWDNFVNGTTDYFTDGRKDDSDYHFANFDGLEAQISRIVFDEILGNNDEEIGEIMMTFLGDDNFLISELIKECEDLYKTKEEEDYDM